MFHPERVGSLGLYLQEHSYIINLFYCHALENGMKFLLIFEIQPLSQVLNNSLTITTLRYQSITVQAIDCYKYTILGKELIAAL